MWAGGNRPASPQLFSGASVPGLGAPHGLLDQPLGDGYQHGVLSLAALDKSLEGLFRTARSPKASRLCAY